MCFLALFPGKRGGGGGCGAIGIAMYLYLGRKSKEEILSINSPVEALILFNEEHQGLLKLQVPLG